MWNWLAVACGAATGGVLRYGVALWFGGRVPGGFPWGTLFINITGSAFIGFFSTLSGAEGRLLVSPQTKLLVMTGICGGYTTFSSFSLRTLRFALDRQWLYAGGNILLSLALCLVAVWLGYALGTALNSMKGN